MDKYMLDILVCPVSHTKLIYDKERQELLCRASRLAYPIHESIPVMIPEEARRLTVEEWESLKP